MLFDFDFYLFYQFDPVVYLPDSMEPPDLDTMPMGMLTGAMLPDAVAPADAVSIISLALI